MTADELGPPGSESSALDSPSPPPVEAWKIVANTGVLCLGQSPQEYAVYDDRTSYGRWPLTEEGHRYAVQTYEAHRQSRLHGVAYSATGYQDPARLGLPTDPVMKSKSYSSPLSYVGSTRRIVSWAKNSEDRSPAFSAAIWMTAVLALILVWVFLVFWYVLIFGVFGIFVIPYRLVRRSQRKGVHVQQTALATQQAMLQQMAAQRQAVAHQMAQQNSPYPPPGSALPPVAPPAIREGPPAS
jgi:hypothetical protein